MSNRVILDEAEMIKIIEKGLMSDQYVFDKIRFKARNIALEPMRMCRNSDFKDPIALEPMRMCRNSDFKDPIALEPMRMCRNSGYKDPIALKPMRYDIFNI